jgi:hypothetical protein
VAVISQRGRQEMRASAAKTGFFAVFCSELSAIEIALHPIGETEKMRTG